MLAPVPAVDGTGFTAEVSDEVETVDSALVDDDCVVVCVPSSVAVTVVEAAEFPFDWFEAGTALSATDA